MARKNVGKSGVTPCKHFLLDKLLGQEAGVYGRGIPADSLSAVWVDMTAGDGAPTRVEKPELSCSPGIFSKHASYVLKCKKPLKVFLCEKNKKTFSDLTLIMNGRWWAHDVYPESKTCMQLIGDDSSDYFLDVPFDSSCFIYNDPNSITQWSYTEELLKSLPKYTRTLNTLGCNVAGVKRELAKNPEMSKLWRDNIHQLLNYQRHPAVLMAVGNASQWAYLITTPEQWIEDTKKLCIKAWEYTYKISEEFRKQVGKKRPRVFSTFEKDNFNFLLDELLMTKEQFENQNTDKQTELPV